MTTPREVDHAAMRLLDDFPAGMSGPEFIDRLASLSDLAEAALDDHAADPAPVPELLRSIATAGYAVLAAYPGDPSAYVTEMTRALGELHGVLERQRASN